jgi:RHS repeat-associated protein
MGNRVSKTEIFPEDKPGPFGEKEITTYYVRDAQGNVMAVYNEQKYEDGKIDLSLTEQHLYGSSRLGMRQVNELLVEKDEIKEFEPEYSSRNLGEKVFELTNHLGNVLAVVSDKKLANNEPDVKATFDYFPFGSPMPGRVNEREEYRYGFTGHEKENEVTAGIYSTETRLLDTRLGIWRGVDELFMKYPDLSSYNYVVNNPITFVDFDGREISYSYEYEKDKDGKEIQDKNGNKNITGVTMNFVGKIINNSGDNINMDRAAKDIASDIKTAFSGDVEIGGKTIPMQVNVELLPVSSMTEVSDNDHLFVLVNGYGKVGGGVNMMGGKVMNIYAGDYANDNMFSNNLSWNSTRSAVHEFGHAAGLTHGSASGWRNLMRQGGGGINVTPLQRGYLLRNQNNINKGVNSYGGRPYPYMHYYERGVEYVIPVYKVFNMGK